jgi:hypothetical protein
MVEHTYNWREDTSRIRSLLKDPGWKTLNAIAKLYIIQNLKVEDKVSIQSLKTSREMWVYVLEKYKQRT